jgi:SSS family solute:Na+ symporter
LSASSIALMIAVSLLYLFVALGVAAFAKSESRHNANDYLNATGSQPTWVASLSFLACNCGALEVLGLSGIAARYGVQAFHFFWIGAIPALIFLSFVVLPVYVRSGVRSIPEYLGQRFDARMRTLNACAVLLSSAAYVGIALYGLSEVMRVATGCSFVTAICIFSPIVLAFVALGGLRATIYNESLNFGILILGLAPLLYLTKDSAPAVAARVGQYWHVWQATHLYSTTQPVDGIGVIIGLGCINSFAYWCTDFSIMQRALTARTLDSARRVPLFAGFGKLVISLVIVVPILSTGSRHLAFEPGFALDSAGPALIKASYGPSWMWLGMAALLAGLLNTLLGNLSAFSALWTEEIYRPTLQPGRTESHYLSVARWSMLVCIALGISAAYATRRFENLSEFVLLIFSMFLVPFFAVILVGLVRRNVDAGAALVGAVGGMITSAMAHLAYARSWLSSGSPLNASFYSAIPRFHRSPISLQLALRPRFISPPRRGRGPARNLQLRPVHTDKHLGHRNSFAWCDDLAPNPLVVIVSLQASRVTHLLHCPPTQTDGRRNPCLLAVGIKLASLSTRWEHKR